MALSTKEKYDQRKIDSLLHYLHLYADKGKPIDFEIIVDGFKAVRRTNDLDMFSLYENFVTPDTRAMEILLYTGSSNNNDKRMFYFGEEPREASESLSGTDVRTLVDEQVQRITKDMALEKLQQEKKELEQHIADLEGEVEELEKQNARLQAKQSPLNGFLGEVGSSLVESFIKRNPKLMAAFPGGEALAGLLQADNTQEEDTPETKVQFNVKEPAASGDTLPDKETAPTLTESQQAAVQFVNQLKAQFNQQEFEKVLLLLQAVADDKNLLDELLAKLGKTETSRT